MISSIPNEIVSLSQTVLLSIDPTVPLGSYCTTMSLDINASGMIHVVQLSSLRYTNLSLQTLASVAEYNRNSYN